jgi:hypothetical protein
MQQIIAPDGLSGRSQGTTVEHIGYHNTLLGNNGVDPWDVGLRRPYLDRNGRIAVTVNTGRHTVVKGQKHPVREHRLVRDLVNNGTMDKLPVTNATALRKEEWLELDSVILRAARFRLRAWADLAAANSFGGFNGMSKLVLEHETMSDPGEAIVDMDGLTEGRNDAPQFQLQGLPLPITHSDFWFSSRKLAVSRNSGTPLDTTMGEACGRRVAELIEKTTIGTTTGVTYGGQSTQQGGYGRASTVWGYTNFPARLTYTTLTVPTGTNTAATILDVLKMRQQLINGKFYGPYMLYHSNDWDTWLDDDYILTGGNVATQTLRERLKAIEGITDVRRLDFFFANVPPTTNNTSGLTPPGYDPLGDATPNNPYQMVLVQLTPDVARAVNGMDITTLQWESVAGMRLNFKVMAIQVPQLRADHYGYCGILQGTTH